MEKEGEGKMTELDHITEQVLKQIDGDGFRQEELTSGRMGFPSAMETASILKLEKRRQAGNRCLY